MTSKLYYSNPYLKTSETEIKSITEKDGNFHVALNETIFYPEGGGQPCDRGFIDEIGVLDVYEENDTIFHVLPSSPTQNTVTCDIDFERRFDHMQQHAGEHLLSGVFLSLFDGHNMGFHLGDDYVTIDLSLSDISDSMVLEAENTANELIYKNLEIKTYIVDSETAAKLPLRKPPIVTQSIRIVEIDKVDYSACCGTHVNYTGEIGIIKIVKTQKYKNMTRVYIKCGKRALVDFQNKHDMITNLSSSLSTGESQLISKIESDQSDLKNKSREIKSFRDKLSRYEAQEIINSSQSELIIINFEDKNSEDIESLARQIMQIRDHVLILASLKDKRLLACWSGNYSINLGKIFKENAPSFNGRGGGSNKQAQCSFSQVDDLMGFETFLSEELKQAI